MFLCSSPICNFLLCYLSKMNHTSAAIDNCLPHVIRIDFQLHIVCTFLMPKKVFIIFITSPCILPCMTFPILCVLWLNDLQVRSPAVQWLLITWWNIQSLTTGRCGGSFIGHWKAFRLVLGCQGDVIWKRKRQFYSSFCLFLQQFSFFSLFFRS